MLKFDYIISAIVVNLIQKGFCAPESDEGKQGVGEGKLEFRNEENAGVGEGKGNKNVSKDIEFEEQLQGTK